MLFNLSRPGVLIAFAVLAGCAAVATHEFDKRYGEPDPARFDQPVAISAGVPDYRRDVRPVLERRCVVCHACYDAPCQLNLNSWAGIARGANKNRVYDSARVVAAEPTRLFLDAGSNAQWRKRDFYPVLNERVATPTANRDLSVLYRMLALKRAHPLPAGSVLPADTFDLSINNSKFCPRIEEMSDFERQRPLLGMPYGLPAISNDELDLLTRWIEAGAPDSGPAPLAPPVLERIAVWEKFLNGDSLKDRLMSRYVYEHWAFAQLYFSDLPESDFFQLVRSRTPPGEPLDVIASRRPYDDPGVARVYYRMRHIEQAPVAKTQLALVLDDARMARLRAWFLDARYNVTRLPGYAPDVASNPFVTFRELPDTARYRFMLDSAHFFMAGFIKGPVCRGQVALDVITDHFWVVFLNPDAMTHEDTVFIETAADKLRFPAEQESTAGALKWHVYSRNEADYMKAKAAYLNGQFGASRPPSLSLLWDGTGIGQSPNPNAALTVYRHFDSATVIQGLSGERPQTVLFLAYPVIERLHYLLVAGYDVYGNVGHQLLTRLYMDFLRMEGELGFIALLPLDQREAVFNRWYRDADKDVIGWFREMNAAYPQETGVRYRTDDPLTELYAFLKRRYAPIAPATYALEQSKLPVSSRATLRKLSGVRGAAATLMPEQASLAITGADRTTHYFTLLRDSAHSNVASLFSEEKRRLPDEDRLQLLRGFVGTYPNAFFKVGEKHLPVFVKAVQALRSEADYSALMDRFGIRRADARFWPHSDALHAAYFRDASHDAGWLDYNRVENR